MWRYNKLQSVSLLMPLVFAFAVALDLYIPAVPQLTADFQTTPKTMQLTLSLFMLSFGFGQLIIGPLTDRFGRRTPLLISAVAYALSSLLCANVTSVMQLVFCRMIQGVASCGMMNCTNALVRDVYSEKEVPIMYSYLNMAIAVSPMIAPLLGGYIDIYFGWRACFYALAMFGAIAGLLVYGLIPETHPPFARAPVTLQIFRRYWQIISNVDFVFYTYAAAAGIACLFSFFSVSPYLLQTQLGVPTEVFGWYFGVMGLLFMMGSWFTAKLLERFSVFQVVCWGAVLMLLGGIMMVTWYELVGLSRLGFILPMIPISAGAAFTSGAGIGGAMSPFPEKAGVAAALFGCSEFVFSSFMADIVMSHPPVSTVPLAGVACAMGVTVGLFALLKATVRK